MLTVDDRAGSLFSGSFDFVKHLKRAGVPVRARRLSFGDFAWNGYGPAGLSRFGVERKTVDEIITAVNDSRFRRRQVTGLLNTYDFPILVVEGKAWPDPVSGILMNGRYEAGRTRHRHLWANYVKFQLTLLFKARLILWPTRSKSETVQFLAAAYEWSTKRWAEHKSVYVVDETKPEEAILTADNLARRTCAQWPQVGWKRSAKVCRYFGDDISRMVNADVAEWNRALGIEEGTKIAAALVAALHPAPAVNAATLAIRRDRHADAQPSGGSFSDRLAREIAAVERRRRR